MKPDIEKLDNSEDYSIVNLMTKYGKIEEKIPICSFNQQEII